MASIFMNGKYWRAQVRRKGCPTMTATFDTREDAQIWAAEQEKMLATHGPQAIRDRLQMGTFTLGDAIDKYEKEILPTKSERAQKDEPGYIRSYRNHDIIRAPLLEVTPDKIWQYLRTKNWSSNTIRLHLSFLSFLFTIAGTEWGMDVHNPVSRMRKPRLPRGRDRRLNDGEEEALLRECTRMNPVLADIVQLALETAMRQGEILSLTANDVNFRTHTVTLQHTKNGDKRIVPLSQKAEDIIRKHVHKKPRLWHYTPGGFRMSYKKAVRKAGIEGLTFHDLRHEATSRLVEKGLPIMTIQAITGHKSMQMLKRYTHISPSALVSALRGVE